MVNIKARKKMAPIAASKIKEKVEERTIKAGILHGKKFKMVKTKSGHFVPRDPTFPVGESQRMEETDFVTKVTPIDVGVDTKVTGKGV